MPYPAKPDRYPVEFHQAFNLALERGEVTIPTSNPRQLRMKFYGFIGALRRDGNTKGDLIEIIESPGKILLRHRSKNPQAMEIAAAIAQANGTASPDGESVFKRIVGDSE